MKDTKIPWCGHTFSPWIGCTKVSPGCDNCYAEAMDRRFGGEHWGVCVPSKRTGAAYWRQPLKWNAEAERCRDSGLGTGDGFRTSKPPRPRVFCGSMCDWLDDEAPIEWLADLLALIRKTPNLYWLLLTKRPENWGKRLRCAAVELIGKGGNIAHDWLVESNPPPNVWLGVTVENQAMADKRIPEFLKIPARVRFLSCEPLLGAVDLVSAGAMGCNCQDEKRCSGKCSFYRNTIDNRRIDWVICGGESGANARPMHPDWARSLRDQCAEAGVPFFFKQGSQNNWKNHSDFSEAPADLQIREFPNG